MEEVAIKTEEKPATTKQEVTPTTLILNDESEAQPLSKNQQKKLARRQKFLENKLEFKQKKKERLKLKRKEERESGKAAEKNSISRKVLAKNKVNFDDKSLVRIAVDLSFDHLMSESNITSCASQLMRIYTCNRRQKCPIPVYFTSLKEGNPIQQRLANMQGYLKWDVKSTEKSFSEIFPKDKIIYLTAESENVLETLLPETLYVIGGLVDHNSHKGLTHQIATKEGFKTARLPISEHVNLKTRHVFTVNHVAEILIRKANGRTWKQVFEEILPQRKGFEILKKKKDNSSDLDDSESNEINDGSSSENDKKRKLSI